MRTRRAPRSELRPGARKAVLTRAALIWMIGVVVAFLPVPVYGILPAYGILFVIGAGMLSLSVRALFVIASAIAVTAPLLLAAIDHYLGSIPDSEDNALAVFTGWHYPFVLWAAFIAAGIAAGRLLQRAQTRVASALTLGGAAVAAVGYAVIAPIGDRVDDRSDDDSEWLLRAFGDEPHGSGIGEAVGSGGFALALIGACTLLCRGGLRWLTWPLRALGSMPLTAYVAHLIGLAIWLAAAGDGSEEAAEEIRSIDAFWPMTIGIVVACCAWSLCVGRGPLEAGVAKASAYLRDPLGGIGGGNPRITGSAGT